MNPFTQYQTYGSGYGGVTQGTGLNIFDPVYLIATIAVLFLILLIIREFFTWYWKLNKIVSLLEDIKKNTSAARTISAIPTAKTEQPMVTKNIPVQIPKEVRKIKTFDEIIRENPQIKNILAIILFILLMWGLYYFVFKQFLNLG